MKIPNLIGMDVSYSINMLLKFSNKYDIIIKNTSSPKEKNTVDCLEYRVVRQKVNDNSIELIVSCF